jgi:hypothetical protein
MGLDEEQKILQRIQQLRDEHHELDNSLTDRTTTVDQLSQQRIKKRKLWLKDEIARLFDYLEPDIIA